MLWTYRIFRDQIGRYSIHEVFYERDGRLLSVSKNPVLPVSTSLEDLMQVVQWFRDAFDSPVLCLEAVEAELFANATVSSEEKTNTQRLSLQEVMNELAKDDDFELEIERSIA